MKFQTKAQREIAGTALCVIGLSFIMIAFFIFAGKCDLSLILGAIVGSAASILNCSFHALIMRISAKYNSKKVTVITWLLNVFRMFFICTIAFIIFLSPILHDLTGIVTLFFPQINRAIIKSQIKD